MFLVGFFLLIGCFFSPLWVRENLFCSCKCIISFQMPATASSLVCFHILHTLPFSPCSFLFFSCFHGSACSCKFCGLLILPTTVFLANENISTDVVTFCNLISGSCLFFPMFMSTLEVWFSALVPSWLKTHKKRKVSESFQIYISWKEDSSFVVSHAEVS